MNAKIERTKVSRVALLSDLHDLTDSVRARYAFAEEGVVVRYRGSETGGPRCLRITVWTEEDNKVALGEIENIRKVMKGYELQATGPHWPWHWPVVGVLLASGLVGISGCCH